MSCCDCKIFDISCIKKAAGLTEELGDDNATFVYAYNEMMNSFEDIIGDACFNSLCAHYAEENTATPWDEAETYEVDQTVLYNGVYYIAIQGGTNQPPDISPLFWSVCGFTAEDKALIKKAERWAGNQLYILFIQNSLLYQNQDGITSNAKEDYASKMGVQLKFRLQTRDNAKEVLEKWLVDNADDYPCYVVPEKYCKPKKRDYKILLTTPKTNYKICE